VNALHDTVIFIHCPVCCANYPHYANYVVCGQCVLVGRNSAGGRERPQRCWVTRTTSVPEYPDVSSLVKKLYLPLPGNLCYRRGLNGGADKRATLVELNIEYKLLQSPYYRSAYLSSETEVT